MTLSDLRRQEARGQILHADLLNNARTIRPITTKFGRITHVGRGVFLDRQPRCCYPKGAEPQRSPYVRVPFYLCTHPLTQNYQIWCGNTYGDGACFGGHTRPHCKGAGFQRSLTWGSLLLMCTPLSQNYQVWYGKWQQYGKGAWFRGLLKLSLAYTRFIILTTDQSISVSSLICSVQFHSRSPVTIVTVTSGRSKLRATGTLATAMQLVVGGQDSTVHWYSFPIVITGSVLSGAFECKMQ